MRKLFHVACVVAAATSSTVADLPRLDSSQFDCKYEMVNLPSNEDIDGDGDADFKLELRGAASFAPGSGVDTGSVMMNATNANDSASRFISDAEPGSPGSVWRSYGIHSDDGYTIEARLKITECTGQNGAIVLHAAIDNSVVNSWLVFFDDKIKWGDTVLTNLDTSVYHTYRIVREGKSVLHSVYVDGVLVQDNLGDGFVYRDQLRRIVFGSAGSGYTGKAQAMWLRFQKGAYAPPLPLGKESRRWSGDFPVQYEMTADDARFVGTGNGTDWTGTVSSGVGITQNGVLAVSLPQGKRASWKSNDAIWSAIVSSNTAYTLEFRASVRSCLTDNDRTFQFWCGNPRAAGLFYVGEHSVQWQPSESLVKVIMLDTSDNTDAMHTFRVSYDGATRHGYTFWRDGVVIGANLVDCSDYNSAVGNNPNFLRFGVVSLTTYGGSFDIDYIRWTTDGAWQYLGPPKGMIICIK